MVAGIEAGDEAAILPALKWLRDGHTHAEAASIREDLERAIRKTRAPLWIDPAIVASLRQHGAPPPGP